jgi:hypothetical protein
VRKSEGTVEVGSGNADVCMLGEQRRLLQGLVVSNKGSGLVILHFRVDT